MCRLTWILSLSVFLGGCEIFGPGEETGIPDVIAAFVLEYDLPDKQPVRVIDVMEEQVQDVDLFTVSFGPPADCPSGCFYATVYGLRRDRAIGWLTPEKLPAPERSRTIIYDFTVRDGLLYTERFFARLDSADQWAYRYVFLPVLVNDPDVPLNTLLRVARGLHDYIQPSLAWILLENEVAVGSNELLTILAQLPVFQGDAYAEVRRRAEQLLARATRANR